MHSTPDLSLTEDSDAAAERPSPIAPWSLWELACSLGVALLCSLAALLLLHSSGGPLWLRSATYAFFAAPLVHLTSLCFAAFLVACSSCEHPGLARLLRCAGLALGVGVVCCTGLYYGFVR